MADSVVQGLSADPSRIPSKWNRNTVADGDWLQFKTLDKLSARDVYLASAIDTSTQDWKDAVEAEETRATAAEEALDRKIEQETSDRITDVDNEETRARAAETALQYAITDETNRATREETRIENLIVQEQTRAQEAEGNLYTKIETEITNREEADRALAEDIEGLKAATDVISVFGTYAQFVNGSADLHATDKDFIKVLADESRNNVQTYYQSTVTTDTTEPTTEDEEPVTTTTTSWAYVTALPPYYDTSTIDGKFNDISATVANNYLSANDTDVSAGKNLDVVIQSNNPRVAFKTKDDVSFSNLTSTNTISTNFSGKTLSGETLYTSIDGLIESATNGGAMTGVKNLSAVYFDNYDGDGASAIFNSSADSLRFYISGGQDYQWIKFKNQISDEHLISIEVPDFPRQISSKLSIFDFKDWSGSENSLFSGTSRLANSAGEAADSQKLGGVLSSSIINSAENGEAAYKAITGAKFTATNGSTTTTANLSGGFNLIAGEGIGISHTNGSTGITITAEGTTYTEGDYIDIDADNSINVETGLVNSAKSGASAQNYINENARYHIKKINFNSTDGTPTLLDFITSAGTTTTINYSAWKDQPNQSNAFLTVTNDSTNYTRYWSVASSLVLSAVSGKYMYDQYANTNVRLTGNSITSYSLSDGLNLVAGDGINLDYNTSDKKITFSVDSNDYIPYSAVEVKTMGTDNCVGSLASGSNVLKIAASYAYKDENGDRIDTSYVKNSAMNNWITDTNSVFSGTCLSSVYAGSPFPMASSISGKNYNTNANFSSFSITTAQANVGATITLTVSGVRYSYYPNQSESATWASIIRKTNENIDKYLTCSAVKLSTATDSKTFYTSALPNLNKITFIAPSSGPYQTYSAIIDDGDYEYKAEVDSGCAMTVVKAWDDDRRADIWCALNDESYWYIG